MLNPDQSGFCPQRSTEEQVIRLSQAISDCFQVKKPANQTVLALLDFSKAYNKVWQADLLAEILRKEVPILYGGSRDFCPIGRQGFALTGLTNRPGS
jgi:hypothetical protein